MKEFRRLVYPYMGWISVFIVVPMLMIMLYAFTQAGNTVINLSFTLNNFTKFFTPVFERVLMNSIQVAVLTTVVCILIGYPMAYIVAKTSERWRATLLLLVTMPQWINMLIRLYALTGILSENGILNTFLAKLGLPTLTLLYTDIAVVIGMVYNFLPFMILPIYTVLAKLDPSLMDASYDLGANRMQTFWRVVFPLSLPGVVSGIIMVFLPAVSTFVIPKMLGGNKMMIGSLIENQFITVGEWNFGSAISLVMAIIIIISMYFMKKLDKDNTERSSGKLW